MKKILLILMLGLMITSCSPSKNDNQKNTVKEIIYNEDGFELSQLFLVIDNDRNLSHVLVDASKPVRFHSKDLENITNITVLLTNQKDENIFQSMSTLPKSTNDLRNLIIIPTENNNIKVDNTLTLEITYKLNGTVVEHKTTVSVFD